MFWDTTLNDGVLWGAVLIGGDGLVTESQDPPVAVVLALLIPKAGK